MKSLTAVGIVLKAALLVSTLFLLGAHATVATEYSQHFGALRKLSVAVAEAMPAEQYVFRPDPGSMTFGELISHIARSEEHTSELQSHHDLVCRLLLEKK